MYVLTVRYEPFFRGAAGCRRGVITGAWVVSRCTPTGASERPVWTGPCGLYLLSPRPYRRGVRVSPRTVLMNYWAQRRGIFAVPVWCVASAQRPYTMEVFRA